MMQVAMCLILGLAAGIYSGLLGLGGGIIVVPALVILFGMSQHVAQGTTLAMMIPPIGLLAAWQYYKQGFVDLKIAALLCAGFFIGGLIGAKFGTGLSEAVLRRLFGAMLLLISLKMLIGK